MQITREHITLAILSVILLVLLITSGAQIQSVFTVGHQETPSSPHAEVALPQEASGTPVYAVEKSGKISILVGNNLYGKGDFYFEKNTTLSTSTLSSLTKKLIANIPERGARAIVLDVASSPDSTLVVFTVRIDPSENEWGTYTTYAYHKNTDTIQKLFSSTDSRDYASTVVSHISGDNKYIAFLKNACAACDGGPFDTLLYEIKTGNTENIGPTLEFEWNTDGNFKYKPCTVASNEGGFGVCTNQASSTPFEEDRFST
jgi:hypothetical protein